MTADDNPIPEAAIARQSNAPRVTPADIKAAIAAEHYFTMGEALRSLGHPTSPEFDLLTVCALKLKNGFTVIGESACASPENFDAVIGQRIARENAVNKVWPLLGYELRSKLTAVPSTFQERVLAEKAELEERIQKLVAFLGTPAYEGLAEHEKSLLVSQATAMRTYANVLDTRISTFNPPADDFPLGKACDLSGEGACESCQ